MERIGLALESDARLALESDARIERMDRVALLFGEITAATREFLAALARSDRHRDWEDEGFGSCAEWLAWRIGITRGTANEKVRAALALENLPLISGAMARGELSFSKIRALTRVAAPENEAELLAFARAGSAANLERLVRSWKKLNRSDERQQERIRHASRCFSVFPDEDGMYVVRGRLDPEVGAALMRSVSSPSERSQQGSGIPRPLVGPGRSVTRSCSTSKPQPSPRRASPASASSRMAPEFPRELLGGWRVTRADSRFVTTKTARCSTWVARPVQSHRRFAVRSTLETVDADSQAVGSALPKPTTSCTGRTAEKPSWRIPCCCVGSITEGSTKVAIGSVATGTGRSRSSHQRGTRCSRHRRCPSYRGIRWRRWCVGTAGGESRPSTPMERRNGNGTVTSRGRSRRRP